MRIAQGVVALGHAELAKVLTRGAAGAHVMASQQGEAGVGAACAVRIDTVLRKTRKLADGVPEGVYMVGIASQASHNVGVSRLHGPRGPAQANDAAGA